LTGFRPAGQEHQLRERSRFACAHRAQDIPDVRALLRAPRDPHSLPAPRAVRHWAARRSAPCGARGIRDWLPCL